MKKLTKTVPPKKGPQSQGLKIPPKKGPVPQGLQISSNKIQIVKTNKKGT